MEQAKSDGRFQPSLEQTSLDLLYRIGGRELVLEITAVFLQSADTRLRALQAALRRGDRPRVKGVAHSIKSSAGQLGAVHLRCLAEQIELGALSADRLELDSLFEKLNDAFGQTQAELEALREKV